MTSAPLRAARAAAEDGEKSSSEASARKRRRRRLIASVLSIAALVVGSLLFLVSARPPLVPIGDQPPNPAASRASKARDPFDVRARKLLGNPPSGGIWFSGAWAGGDHHSTQRITEFGAWRGTPTDSATIYAEDATWQEIRDSDWSFAAYKGFDGVLTLGLPMLPEEARGDFSQVITGDHDGVYEKVARDLVARGREHSVVRIGWEVNGDWFPWNARASDASNYVAAYRHIAYVLHRIAPELVIDFDLACGTPLRGQVDRLDALNLLYPGDDVVDVVGCDFFDWHNTASTDETSWSRSIRPENSVGIQDVADFARAHGKGLSYPEWGLASPEERGAGDNPFFIEKMRAFFEANADILVLEGYFSEPDTSLANSIWDPAQMPRSAEVYQRLW